jgi:hypothetical protein
MLLALSEKSIEARSGLQPVAYLLLYAFNSFCNVSGLFTFLERLAFINTAKINSDASRIKNGRMVLVLVKAKIIRFYSLEIFLVSSIFLNSLNKIKYKT